eukprot:scaffold2159_cov200-Alexandrium_tamarense.AAC.14
MRYLNTYSKAKAIHDIHFSPSQTFNYDDDGDRLRLTQQYEHLKQPTPYQYHSIVSYTTISLVGRSVV